jgi:hypothetical protein
MGLAADCCHRGKIKAVRCLATVSSRWGPPCACPRFDEVADLSMGLTFSPTMPCRCPACLQCPHVCTGIAEDRHARKIRRQHRGGCASKLQPTTTSNSGFQVVFIKPWQLASNAVLMLYPSSLPYCHSVDQPPAILHVHSQGQPPLPCDPFIAASPGPRLRLVSAKHRTDPVPSNTCTVYCPASCFALRYVLHCIVYCIHCVLN